MHEVVQVIHADHVADPDSHRVVGLTQGVIHQHGVALAAGTAVVGGPIAPDVAAGLGCSGVLVHIRVLLFQHFLISSRIERRVQNLGRVVDQAVIQRQAVGADGLHGRTGLVRDRGAVGAQVVLLFANAAADAQDVAGIVQDRSRSLGADFLIHAEVDGVIVGIVRVGGGTLLQFGLGIIVVDGDVLDAVDSVAVLGDGQAGGFVVLHIVPTAGIRRVVAQGDRSFVPEGRNFIIGVVQFFLDDALDLGIDGGVDAQAAVKDQRAGFLGRVVGLLLQVVEQLIVECIGEVGVVGGAGHVLGTALALHHLDGLRRCGIILILGDVALVVHLIQHVVAALHQLFGVGEGVVLGRILGDGCEDGALREGQILDMLAKVLVGASLHAANDTGQRDGVEVGFQDGLFAVLVGQTQGAEYLAHLTHLVGLIIAGQVFDQLLFQRGCTLLGAVQCMVGKLVQRGTDGTLDIDAGLVVEVLILDSNDRVLEVLRHGGKLAPDTVLALGQGGVLVAVFVVDNGGLFVFLVIQVQDIAIVCRDLHDVHREQDAAYAGRHDADAKQAADKAEECRHRVALTLRFLFVGYRLPGGPCGRFYAIG